MEQRVLAGLFLAACLLTPVSAPAADDAALFRVFLKDGSTLVSYGEFARVGDRVVFSMPTAGADRNQQLQVVDIPADRVDWTRTDRYAEAARATQYINSRAEADYVALSNDLARTLDDVAKAPDAASRLAVAQNARATLAEWPKSHFFYRAGDVNQMIGMLDDAILDLKAAAGSGSGPFNLTLSAYTGVVPVYEPLMTAPTMVESIQQTLVAARIADSPDRRESLLEAALTTLERDAPSLPADWAAVTRTGVADALAHERSIDRAYQALAATMMPRAEARARAADVHGLEQVIATVLRRDAALGNERPDAVADLVAAIQNRLDTVRELQLARDRWLMRLPALRAYRSAISDPVDLLGELNTLKPALQDIKSLAGSTPAALMAISHSVALIVSRASAIVPPDELKPAHALIVSAARMAETAASIRREAVMSGSMARAWDASSAAAGALMLSARAAAEVRSGLRRPELSANKIQ